MSVMVAVAVGVLYAAGTFLLLQRLLTRIILGLALIGHASVLILLFAAGPPGSAPLARGGTAPVDAADPLPQALSLTAIVITFGVIVFLLALSLRSWLLFRDDEVEDDVEDARLLEREHEDQRVELEQDALEAELDQL